jgi:ATP-dependent Clp protease ATP-binding subunit ClpA
VSSEERNYLDGNGSSVLLDFLADVGFDHVCGARPLKLAIQRELEARGILSEEYSDGDTIIVDVVNERLKKRSMGRQCVIRCTRRGRRDAFI